jgi:hypothetical protein
LNPKFFKRLKDEPLGKHTMIEDPDGHLISLAEIKSKADEGFDLIGLFGKTSRSRAISKTGSKYFLISYELPLYDP